MNRTDNEDRRFLIPAGFPQYFASVFRWMWFKGPCRVGAKLGWNPERTQKRPRFHVASDDHRVLDVTLAHGLNEPVHVTCLAAVGNRNLVFRRCQPQRTDHHGRQRIGELALEHRAFACDDAVTLPHLAKEKRRVNVGKVNLARPFEVAFGALEALRHHAEIDVRRAKNVPNLPQHLLHAHVAAGIARAVIAGEEQLQLFAWSPALTETEHPAEARDLNQRADPRDEKEVRHARALPAA